MPVSLISHKAGGYAASHCIVGGRVVRFVGVAMRCAAVAKICWLVKTMTRKRHVRLI